MARGRPVHSIIRQNIIEILNYLGSGYGYEIYKVYTKIFDPVTLRSMYYHLRKGTTLEEFKKEKVEVSSGNYSWGDKAEKIFYSLGPNAKARGLPNVKEYFDNLKK